MDAGQPASSRAMSSPPGVSVSTIAATATATTGCHMLKFGAYKLIKRMHGNGQAIAPCPFEAAGHTSRIQFYPNGSSGYYDQVVSLWLFLVLDDAAADVHAEVKFSLLRHRGRPHSRSVTAAFKKGKGHGFHQFINTGRLERRCSGFLKDDCFAIRCDITVLEKSAVMVPVVQACDLERLGIVCDCNDELCKRHHVRTTASEPGKSFARFFCFRL